MSDSKPAPASVEELTIVMNEIAREFVTTDADDPRRASLVKHLKISPKFGCPSAHKLPIDRAANGRAC